MFFFASQLRSILSPQRSLDRPLPPFFRRETPQLANSFASRYDVTESRPIQTTTRTPTATRTTSRIERLPVMTLCKFYQQGNCKFGNSCRFEHPARNQPQNRFGALSGGGVGGASGGASQDPIATKYGISPAIIEKDLTTEKPQWILSAYAPGRDAPDQLFGGYPREQSFEELRLHYMAGKAAGNEQQALGQAQELYQNAQQQIETAVRNVQEAARFMIEGENRHPNRHDICREGTQGAPFGEFLVGRRPNPSAGAPTQANPFASGASSAASPFGGGAQQSSSLGQPSALGQRPNPFGAPAFGQPAQPAAAFGQPAQPASGFGQPSQPASSPFGQPQPAQGGAGGGSSAFGQAPQPSSAFGQPSALGAKPNPFGTPAFGQPAQPNAQAGAFGQPSQLGQKPNPFGSNANATASSSPFATMGGGSDNAPAANPFGAPSSTPANAAPNAFSSNSTNQNNNGPSPFGQPPQPSAGPFAQAPAPASNPFGAANQQQTQEANNPFAQKPQPQTNGTFGQPASNTFGQNTSQSNAQNAASPFGQQPGASQPSPFGAAQTQQQPAAAAAPAGSPYPPGSTKQHPSAETYISKTVDGRLAAFKGKPVTYKGGQPGNRAFDGTWRRIWFPNGPPAYYKDTELPPNEYDGKSKAQWEAFAQTGTFADGIMPDLPPPRECTRWDF
ncbi:hypothetical protein TOPH_06062 [Tolypocladium ophioglossoides CBS 100239]|uniref:C3H1-type domain-containing protein n=1 Tax=Tolypocladium ophioglossoides (strain CBS 100239) TaxID=1163406 RepID=A0A0L0N652_TOLOC|nr:hypothetical protein TOPH_06062 [Tolypocladium ophioglossoides CBS 100239]